MGVFNGETEVIDLEPTIKGHRNNTILKLS